MKLNDRITVSAQSQVHCVFLRVGHVATANSAACRLFLGLLFALVPLLPVLGAQSPAGNDSSTTTPGDHPAQEKPQEPSEEGIPITNQLVISKCASCHTKDEKGNLTRISWERTTPEGWQQALKRMVRLHEVELSPAEARAIVRYLGTNHGLAPEEAKPVMYIAERRMVDEEAPHESLQKACLICHAVGRAMSWRRSKQEWELLIDMHLGYFPVAEFQGFRRRPPRSEDPPPPPGADTRDPAEQAVEFLAENYPLHTPEWSAWRATMRAPKLAGRWLLSGVQPGRGRIYGEVIIEPTAQPDEFTTRARLLPIKTGKRVERTGRAIVYTGYAWRGRSRGGEGGGPDAPVEAREVMMVSRGQSEIQGRWFWGGYDEFGIDVTLRRAGNDPTLFGVDRTVLQAGSTGERVQIFGDQLPTDLSVDDLDFGAGVTVKRVTSQTSSSLTAEVDVSAEAITGKRDLRVGRSFFTGAFAVYDKIDYLKVLPEAAMARLGGTTHPKGYQQFEAIAYHRGQDKKPQTPDDVELGHVDVEWSIEEFFAVYGDDDKEFVGTLSPTGLFTPAREGPNPKRKFGRNNYGDVWVVATYKPAAGETARDGKPATGRAHLVVTVPLYVKWDQPGVSP